MKKVLITGVAGMIGSHLLDYFLMRDHYLIGIDNLSFGTVENIKHNLDNKNFKFCEGNILNIDLLESLDKEIDLIIHLASVKKISESHSRLPTLKVNVKSTENILELARRLKSKVIFTSTSDVYGMSTDLPFREDANLIMASSTIKRWSYAVSKLYCEHLALAYYENYGVPVVILRYFGSFSARSSSSWSGGHIPIFIDAILKDKEVIIHGDGSQTRSMAYIDDLVESTFLASEEKRAVGEIINIGSSEEMSIIDTARLIHRLANTHNELKIKYVPMEEVFGEYKEVMRRVPDLSKAKLILGYEPKVSLKEALIKVLEARKTTLSHIS